MAVQRSQIRLPKQLHSCFSRSGCQARASASPEDVPGASRQLLQSIAAHTRYEDARLGVEVHIDRHDPMTESSSRPGRSDPVIAMPIHNRINRLEARSGRSAIAPSEIARCGRATEGHTRATGTASRPPGQCPDAGGCRVPKLLVWYQGPRYRRPFARLRDGGENRVHESCNRSTGRRAHPARF